MPLPSEVHVDEVLTNLSIDFKNSRTGLIGAMIAPVIPVKKSSGTYFKYDVNANFRIPKTARALRTRYPRIEWAPTKETYSTEEHGLEQPIDDKERRDADSPLDLDRDDTEILTNLVLLSWEYEVATAITTAASYASGHSETLSGTAQWSDFAGSDPFTDIDDGIEVQHKATGQVSNTFWCGKEVWKILRRHPDLLARLEDDRIKVLTPELFTVLFDEIDQVLIGTAIRETAKEGATSSRAYIWGKDAGLAFVEPAPGLKKQTLAYQFVAEDIKVVRYRSEEIKSDVIRVQRESGLKFVANQCGYIFKAAVA